MDKVKNILSTFIDINSLSPTRILVALGIFLAFFVLKGILSRLIIRLFNIKEKNKENIKQNSFYKPLKLFFLIIGLYCALRTIKPTPYFIEIINKVFRIMMILLCTNAIANLVTPKSRFGKTLKKKLTRANDSMVKMICKTLNILIYLIGIVIIISELGYNISGIITGLGIGGVAIALAAQDTASNIIGAIMIILDKPFELGDWIKIGTIEGSVEEFTFRSTRIREAQTNVVSIPNSEVVNSQIINWSKLTKRRILVELCLEFETPLKKVADVQNDILILLENDSDILNDGISVKFSDIKDDGYNLKIIAFTSILNYMDYLAYMDKLNYQLINILQKNKVSLAYKSQTLYLKK